MRDTKRRLRIPFFETYRRAVENSGTLKLGTLGKNKWGARAWETNYTKQKKKTNKTQ